MTYNNAPVLKDLKKWMGIILIFAIIFEIIIFPSWANALGCVMAILSYLIFSFFYIKNMSRFFPLHF